MVARIWLSNFNLFNRKSGLSATLTVTFSKKESIGARKPAKAFIDARGTNCPVSEQETRYRLTGRITSQLIDANVNGPCHGGMDVAWRQLSRQSADMQSNGRRRDFHEVPEMCVDAFDHRNVARFVFLPHPSDMTCVPPLFDEVGERTLNGPHRVPITQIFRRVNCCGKTWRRNQEANAQTW